MLNIIDHSGMKVGDEHVATTSVPPGKVAYVWLKALDRGGVEHLAAALADNLVGHLFVCDDRVCLLSGRALSPITVLSLRELIDRVFVTPKLVDRGGGSYDVVYDRISDLTSQELKDILLKLPLRCPQGVSRPRVLPEQMKREIVDRIRMGEAQEAVSSAYNIPVAAIHAVMTEAAAA
jgi:hypothetical protein